MPQTFSNNHSVYSVDMMFAYLKSNNHPITKIFVQEYLDVLEYPGWGDPSKNIYYSAIDVINNPMKYKDDFKRILKADLSYPIIISADGFIVDGVHRLTKAYLEKIPQIKAYVFNEELMVKFKIADKTFDVWEKIDNMPIYEIISLYTERFCN
ncbi:hypothetical protein QJ857_gp0124 [Tupanvirus soda lake]|uniref:ParB/Sulfiredoxin domain-containing protein n=2 Tax=Tupanvirus TaxID=2094720 RepID=A0A6N1NQ26_9VIRU|nr:hypothetical protein QJ857_gp0124 [Tupanvirus soda lake]QKU35900.1 hypothetical protein [Tupanvirus soda lake]